jgi:hypothetical protein
MSPRGRVLFIGGWGRSGSTVLDRLLGQVPGVFSAGEIREVWERGCLQDRPCGCDEPFHGCEVWSEIGRVAFGGWGALDLDEALRLRFSVDRPWMAPVIASPWAWPSLRGRIERYVDIVGRLYRAIFEVTGARVVVDSSKIPSHAFLLRRVEDVDLRVLHLIRDSRGAAHSWQKLVEKKVTSGDPQFLPRYGPLGSSARWLVYNAQTSVLRNLGVPYRRVRYEDLMTDPLRWTTRILAFADVRASEGQLPFTGPHEVVLRPNHTVDGNPVRFSTGSTRLTMDEAWRRDMPPLRRSVVTIATLPGLLRYGYRPFAARPS